VALLSVTSMAAPIYTITDLGVGTAFGINETGQVTGLAGSSGFQAFSYLNGVKTIFGGSAFGRSASRGWGINESGVIAGSFAVGANGPVNGDAFRWQNGAGSIIPLVDAYGINDHGVIVGNHINGNVVDAATWSNGIITDLGTLGGNSSRALDINNAGVVVGINRDAAGFDHAYVWDGTNSKSLSSRDSAAQDINELGQIVGVNKIASGANHATLWQNGQTIDLDTLHTPDSVAYAINDKGTIVGYAGFAFIYQDGQMQLLDDLIDPNSGWQLRIGYDINNAGQIVGSGDFRGATHAFLLTPIPPVVPPAAPLPAGFWPGSLLAIAACVRLRFKAGRKFIDCRSCQ
jgi:probable HAF family extracellular repeat protein